ncbi:MAG: hypothetical protein IT461_14295 [Planctomycetes bacterium]|nr:hypothetical protein [Planctomycetota bacterium]
MKDERATLTVETRNGKFKYPHRSRDDAAKLLRSLKLQGYRLVTHGRGFDWVAYQQPSDYLFVNITLLDII